jgi:ABC-2 type transport system permease protein
MMARRAQKYVSYALVRLATLKEYVSDFVGGILLLPVEVAIVVLVWRVIYACTGPLGQFSLEDMIAYQLLVYALSRGTWPVGTINYRVWQDIRQGKLDICLARPIDYQLSRLASELGEAGYRSAMHLLAYVATCAVLRLPVLSDPLLWGAFLLSIAGGFVLRFLIQFAIACMAFWTEAIFGVRDIVVEIESLLSGRYVPVSIMPGLVRSIASVLPFQFTLFLPISIYLGHYMPLEALEVLGWQALWVAVLLLATRLLWQRGLARYEAQGG